MKMILVWLKEHCFMWATLVFAALLAPALAWAQAPCTHYAAPAGSGNGLTQATPFRISNFWAVASPGATLCLLDGTYTGRSSMITPPAGVHGTVWAPITIRALHDGRVLLDAQHSGPAVSLQSSWFIVEGINAKNGMHNIYVTTTGSTHNTLRRVIGYDGTAGQANSYPFDILGTANRVEDSAGWGIHCRKIFNSSQAGNVGTTGFKRTWGEWNGHPMAEQEPSNTYQLGYNTTNQLWENILGTWDLRGQHKDAEGALGAFCSGSRSCEMQGSRILGGIFYAAPGTNFSATKTVQSGNMRGMYYENILAYIAPEFTSKWPFYFYKCSPEQPCSNNVCKDCLAVHAGAKSINEATSGWTLPGWREGQGLEAATGGQSPFLLLPGLCYRYEEGRLTTTPLWPWPMDQRIADARAASGYPPIHVTADIEAILGPIPAACRTGGGRLPVASPAPPPSPPVATPLPPPPDPLLATVRQDLATCRDTLGDMRQRIEDAMQMLEDILATLAMGGS